MSVLPGLSLSAPSEQPEELPPRIVNLSAGTEWRFEVAFGASLNLKLLPSASNGASPSEPHGTAEVFGTELAINKSYTFPGGTKAAVYTWHGCTLEAVGESESEYESDETQLPTYANLHFALENLRTDARKEETEGPRVLVIGAEDAGKTSLIKTLVAYAMKTGRAPMTVNLDPTEGPLSLPGSLSACVHGAGGLLDVEDECGGWGSSPISGPSAVPVKMPLVYQFGFEKPEESPDLFKILTTRLALAVTSRFGEDEEVKTTGCFIDTPGSICQTKAGGELIHHIVAEFSVNVVLVVGAERTFSDLSRKYKSAGAEAPAILKLSRSSGSVDRDEKYMRQLRNSQIRKYFFGDARGRLDPVSRIIDPPELAIFKLMTEEDIDAQFLPGGGLEGSTSELYERVLTPSHALENAILAITSADPSESQENIRDASVEGFLYVADIDDTKKKIRILAPSGGRLPGKALVWARWPEGIGDLVA